jgi:hypothetical protein
MRTELSLSAKGLSNLPRSDSKDDFEFIVGDFSYRCPSLVADFLSPRIARMHHADESISEFAIETPDDGPHFPEFLKLGFGGALSVTPSNRRFLLSIGCELGNCEVYETILGQIECDMSTGNVLNRVEVLSRVGANIANEIEFIASHFFEFSSSEIMTLSFDVLRDVLGHTALAIESEDSLYRAISSRVSSEPRFFELFEFIRFEFLSPDSCADFFDVAADNFERVTVAHWESLRSRFVLPVDPKSMNDHLGLEFQLCRSFPYELSAPFEGIIAHLTKQFGGNVHDQGVVRITAHRALSDNPSYAPKNVGDVETNSLFHSAEDPNQWVCFDFKKMKVKPTYYSLRTHSSCPGSCHIKNWAIEASNDGRRWVELDRQVDNNDLNSPLAVKTFEIANADPFKMIRLRQTEPTHNGSDCLAFTALEFFGSLMSPN